MQTILDIVKEAGGWHPGLYLTSLFCDVQGDQCLDASCYQLKVSAHIDREIAARPELVQIEPY